MLSTIGKSDSPYIRASMLGGFAPVVAHDEPAMAEILRQAGIPARALADPDMLVSWSAVGNLMEAAAVRLEQPCLGLDWARLAADPFVNFGPLALLASFHHTLGEWCVASRDYWRYHTSAYRVELLARQDGDEAILRFSADETVPPSRHQIELTMGGVCLMMRDLAEFDDEGFMRVRFQHLEPSDKTCHERLFRCPVEFGAPHNELVFRNALHDLPIRSPADHLERYIAARSGAIPGFDGSARAIVEAIVPSLVGTRYCTLASMATLLSMNSKKLQRTLAKQGTHFAALVDTVRERMARQILVETDVPVARIAGLLGYATTPPFTVAFKRWSGTSPREFRKSWATVAPPP